MVIEAGDAWNVRHRAERPLPRADRNFAELLQELRVVFTGVQILFGFLLTLSFSGRFAEFDDVQRALYVVTLGCAAGTSALIVAPVAAHRILFQRNRKREIVRIGHRLALGGLALLAATLCAGLMLAVDLTVGRVMALVVAGALATAVLVLWVLLPLRMRADKHAAPILEDADHRGRDRA